MIRTVRFLFCDNEHGVGDVTFPAPHEVDPQTIVNHPKSAKRLREGARAAGWRRHNGADYCPDCVECCLERKGDDA